MKTERIRVEAHGTDYPWPFVAVYENRDGGEWVEREAEGGDTPLDAVLILREHYAPARGVEPYPQVFFDHADLAALRSSR